MGSSAIFESNVLLYKNDVFVNNVESRLLYDDMSGAFKVINGADIWTMFKPTQIVGLEANVSGSVRKKHSVALRVRYQAGDEFSFIYQTKNAEDSEQKKEFINHLISSGKASEEAGQLMKTRERVSVDEICAVFKKYGLPSDSAGGQKFIESCIASGFAKGVFDGTGFVSKIALDREQVRYDIVTKFEIGESGAVVLKCPNCGANLPLRTKDSNGKCNYCNSTFAVPKRILDLI